MSPYLEIKRFVDIYTVTQHNNWYPNGPNGEWVKSSKSSIKRIYGQQCEKEAHLAKNLTVLEFHEEKNDTNRIIEDFRSSALWEILRFRSNDDKLKFTQSLTCLVTR